MPIPIESPGERSAAPKRRDLEEQGGDAREAEAQRVGDDIELLGDVTGVGCPAGPLFATASNPV